MNLICIHATYLIEDQMMFTDYLAWVFFIAYAVVRRSSNCNVMELVQQYILPADKLLNPCLLMISINSGL